MTPQRIDAQYPLPALVIVKRTAACRDAGIVHQHRDLAERVVGAVLQPPHILQPADIGRHRDNGCARQLFGGSVKHLLVQIGEANFHAQRREPLRSSEADPTGAAGDYRSASLRQCRMLWHAIAPNAGAAC
jgi:hypothetical protein